MKKILENKNKLIFSATNNTDKVLEVFNSSLFFQQQIILIKY